MIEALRPLEQMYSFFFRLGEDPETKRRPPALQWIAEMMEDSKDASFPGRVLSVLQEMEKGISPERFNLLGKEHETQLQANIFYANLQRLKGRFEGLISS